MPVTITPSHHPSSYFEPADVLHRPVSSPERLLKATLADAASHSHAPPTEIVRSSFSASPAPHSSPAKSPSSQLYSSKNGFVHACVESYNQHLHLIIRPDDVWLAVLTQLATFVNANAEALRDEFVSHEGRVALELIDHTLPDDISKWDHGALAVGMTKLMGQSIKDAGWRDWVLPDFTTTQDEDRAVASVVFMGTLRKYFTYAWGTRCGIPTATLLGERRDWAAIRDRCAERIPSLAPECAEWWAVLKPALDGLVQSFEEPASVQATRFWQGVVDEHVPNGSGATTYSGWITAFCYWDEEGACLHGRREGEGGARLCYGEFPVGFTEVPVTVLSRGVPIPTEMVAGSVGMRATASGAKGGSGGRRAFDTLQPESGWIMYRS